MPVDKFLVQDVIDRLIKYGNEYEEQLKALNNTFPVHFEKKTLPSGEEIGSIRVYKKESKSSECMKKASESAKLSKMPSMKLSESTIEENLN